MTYEDALVRTAELAAMGREGDLRSRLRRGDLERVRSGAYVEPATWGALAEPARILLRARAVAARARNTPVFVLTTAGAAWELPLFRVRGDRVHALQGATRGHKSRGDVSRHALAIADEDIVERGGLLVTSFERTVFDIIRTATPETAVACMDGALRIVAWQGGGRYDASLDAAFRDRIAEFIAEAGAVRGIRQARFVCGFGDGRGQLPGESVSRLWMHRLGAEPPLLQHEVRVRGGRRAYPDFAWPGRRRFGEFDGDGKYIDPQFTRGRDVRRSLRDQRERETAVTEATGWLPVRWGWERLRSLSAFAAFLRSHGVLD